MRGTRFSILLKATVAIFCVAMFVRSAWASDDETLIYSFRPYHSADGANPYGSVIFDAAGNLYGTTASGGVSPQALRPFGTVFELSLSTGGGWTEKVLHSFGKGTDGRYPQSSSLVSDAAGNLYGTTEGGGSYGYGTVFELSPEAGGTWTEKVLYSFGNGTDGQYPGTGLIMDGPGNLYGTTGAGGQFNGCSAGLACGTVFELSPEAGGTWTEKVLHSFGDGTDGQNPSAGLIMDALGNLYGTTILGGMYYCFEGFSCGTVFELSPQAGGGWTETVLHSFGDATDGQSPYAGVIMDGAGNLYGTTSTGGLYNNCDYGSKAGCGTVFKLSPMGGGGWAETVLHNFGNGMDGQNPNAGLIFDGVGNLYGTTTSGGIYSVGTVFELSPEAGGDWMETVLHSFIGDGTDGVLPYNRVTLDASRNIYGTTSSGGIHGTGTVFEITR